jgi:hypothetical protein
LDALKTDLQAGQYTSILQVINEELTFYLIKMEQSSLKRNYMAKKVIFLAYLRCYVQEKILQSPTFRQKKIKIKLKRDLLLPTLICEE